MLKALIVDDEKKSRELLRLMLQKHCPGVFVSGLAASADEAYRLIKQYEPDVVFLDIRMQGGSGFDLLKKFETVNFSVVFVTAYDKYALQAIKCSALDYLLKPVDEEELKEAVEKVREKISKSNITPELKNVITHLRNPGNPSNKIAIHSIGRIELITISDICRCEADGKYTHIFLADGKKFTSSKNLKEYEELLDGYGFFRVHHSHLVSIVFIKQYSSGRGGSIVMQNGLTVPVAQRRKEEFLKCFRQKKVQ